MEPKTWDEVSNKIGWRPIEKWLKDIYSKKEDSLKMSAFALILGGSGCGKSHQFQLLCSALEIRIQAIEAQNGREMIELLEKVYSSDLIGNLQDTVGDKRLILIDDIDVLCSQDRMFSSYLLQFLQCKKYKWIPLVALGNSAYEKKFGELGRQVNPFKLPLMSVGDTYLYLEQCMNYLKLNIEEDILLKIAKLCQGNYLKAFETLKCYTESALLETEETTHFDLIMDTPSYSTMLELFYEDTFGTLLRFHENLYLEIQRRIAKIADKKRWYGIFLKCIMDLEYSLSFEYKSIDLIMEPLIERWVQFCSKHPRKGDSGVEHEFTRLLSRMSLHKKHARRMVQVDYWKDSPYLINILSQNKKSCS